MIEMIPVLEIEPMVPSLSQESKTSKSTGNSLIEKCL